MKLLLPLAFLLASAASLAQPITVSNPNSGGGGYFSGGTDGTFQSNVSHSYSQFGSAYSFNLRGDVTAQLSGTADFFGFQAAARFTLTTGAAPVELTNIVVRYNGKEVVSGGSTATFTAPQFYRAQVSAPGFGVDFGYATYLPDRTTQGVYIENLSNDLQSESPTILAANTAYELYMDVYPTVRVSSYPSSSSMLGYALEFGGSVAPQFDGVTLNFNAVAVPEASSLWMLAFGLVALAARRRFNR